MKRVLILIAAALPVAAQKPPTVEEAKAFVAEVERTLLSLSTDASRADWINKTYITGDTEIVSAKANERSISAAVAFAKRATRFDKLNLPPDVARKLKLLKLSLTTATPADPRDAGELTQLSASMEGAYGRGKYCPGGDQSKCLDLEDITRIMANSRDANQLLDVWRGWHSIAPPLKKQYARYVELGNKGARELGFADMGAMWRSKYDMPPAAFSKEVDRLWEQVKPLYTALHAYVRWKLREQYGDVVPANGPIPAHLLGNMWAQEWGNIYPLVAPKDADPGYDLTGILKKRNIGPLEMVRYGENFFKSLGFIQLPQTFWDRSLFVKPRDREVVCHASAWDIDSADDIRLKMCIDITGEDFITVHHELGHNFYQRAYSEQPYLFRDGANDGFHEAIGDTIALSITPEYLVKVGLLEQASPPSKDIGLLLRQALDKVAFLPFGLMIDQWRWKVFSGEISPGKYNETWWELRRKYQGVAPAIARSEEDFDPGAKYHVPAGVPYTRYFLAHILQFQFHRALAQTAGYQGPLNRCSIFDNKEAGRRLRAMLEMGQSKPWTEALYAMTGEKQIDATAIRDYFAPLQKWLDEQNRGKPAGW